jgi:hypothetical protein
MFRRPFVPCSIFLLLLLAARVDAATIRYVAILNGPSEAPPNASPGTGFAEIIYDNILHTLSYDVDFTDLIGTTTAAHVHCCTAVPFALTAGVATTLPSFPGFPLGVTAGTFVATFDLTLASSWNPAFITANGGTPAGAEAALLTGISEGRAYFNIHTSAFPGGEIRGFFQAPEPITAAMLGLGLAGLGIARYRRRRS